MSVLVRAAAIQQGEARGDVGRVGKHLLWVRISGRSGVGGRDLATQEPPLCMCEWKEQALGNRPMPDWCAPDGGGAEERLTHKVKPLVLRSWGLSLRKCKSQLPIILEDCLVLRLAKGQAGDRDWNAGGTGGGALLYLLLSEGC